MVCIFNWNKYLACVTSMLQVMVLPHPPAVNKPLLDTRHSLHTTPPFPTTSHPPQVLHARSGERAALKDALEMALLGGLSHPHITTLYAALPDMVEEAGGGADLATLLTSGRLTGEWGAVGAGAAGPEAVNVNV